MKSLALILGLLAAVQAFPTKGLTPLDVTIPVIEGAPVPIPPKIVGGKPAKLGQFPHQAFNVIDRSGYCGGSLIATDWILTAAHCVEKSTSCQVILGRIQWQGTGGDSIVTMQKILHQSFNPTTLANDIALLQLPRKVTLTNNIKLVALTTAADASNSFAGVTAQLSGFGLTSNTGDISPNLMWVEVPVITNAVCNQTYGDIIPSMICTSGAGRKGGCDGDSGGPLVITRSGGFTQIGIQSSASTRGCTFGDPTIFSRVTTFRAWIQQKSGV